MATEAMISKAPLKPEQVHRIKAENPDTEQAAREYQEQAGDDESGATAIEYGLIAAGISVAIIAVVQGLGTKLTATFHDIVEQLDGPRTTKQGFRRHIAAARGSLDARGESTFVRLQLGDVFTGTYPVVTGDDDGATMAWTSGRQGQTVIRVAKLPE